MELPELPGAPTGGTDIPTGTNNQPWDCTTTGVEMVEKQSKLPSVGNRKYLHLKVEYAMRFPKLSAEIRRNGKTYTMNLKQAVMSGLIRVEKSPGTITGGTRRKSPSICRLRHPVRS